MVENREMFECCQIWHQMQDYSEGKADMPKVNGSNLRAVQMAHATLVQYYIEKLGKNIVCPGVEYDRSEVNLLTAIFAPEIVRLNRFAKRELDSRLSPKVDDVTKAAIEVWAEERTRHGKPVNQEFARLKMIGYV